MTIAIMMMMMTETVAPVAAGAVEQPPVIRTNSISRSLTPSCNDIVLQKVITVMMITVTNTVCTSIHFWTSRSV